MQALTLTMILVVTTVDFLSTGDRWGRWAILPNAARYLPEMLSILALIYVVLAGTRNRFRYVRPEYWLLFAGLVLAIAFGAIVNQVEAGPIFAGMRNYLRAIVWFLVPAVFAVSDSDLRQQLKVLVLVALLQLPLAIQQRSSTVAADRITGDWTVGSLTGSGTLSVFLSCALCLVAAFYARRLMTVTQFAVLCILLFVPMSLNETKAVIILVPIGLTAAFLAAARPGRRLGATLKLGSLLMILSVIFVPTYDYLKKDRPYAVPITEWVTDPERVEKYLWKKQDVGTTREVGRIDAIVVTADQLSADPIRLAFGFGIGNVSESALGHGFTGEYFRLLGVFATTSISRLALELGLLGVSLILLLLWAIVKDARSVANDDRGAVGAVAGGWVGVVIVIGLSMAYMDVLAQPSLSYLFWYFSGLIAAERMRAGSRQERPIR